ncbi:MAG: hypothetical protein AB7L09_01185 [Nitrospira sp.]
MKAYQCSELDSRDVNEQTWNCLDVESIGDASLVQAIDLKNGDQVLDQGGQ